ncbi:MAG: vitamin B12-dependent ribonucleotide reductase [Candidatus Cloacimonetes bacterium]|nr:vitamin B12-dependent ribonucleotide reductase [Candidatus Cloacimonadota bacterium]MBL7086224.1 vitamin B12-dependent ribonucleotide reductase [Candidatus Cloacimonadota bacterium]
MELTENALAVLKKRYFKKDNKGNAIEDSQKMLKRVSKNIAGNNKEKAKKYYDLMDKRYFLPNSPTLMNAGNDLQQLSACFVLPIEDSMESIFSAVKNAALIHKCLTEDTYIFTNKGIRKINEIPKDSFVLTDEDIKQVIKTHNLGKKEVYKITTNYGYEISGTGEHKIRIVNENGNYVWRSFKELKKWDWVVIQPVDLMYKKKDKLPEFKFEQKEYNKTSFKAKIHKLPKELTEDLAYLFGAFIGDGSFHKGDPGRIRITIGSENKNIVNKLSSIIKNMFNIEPKIRLEANKNSYDISIQSVQIKKWFEFLGVQKISSRNVIIPEIIFNSDTKKMAGFLQGLFDTDGCINKRGYISLTSSSEQMINGLQVLLLYFAIPTIKRELKNTKSWQISVTTKIGMANFIKKIGFNINSKKERLNNVNLNKIFNRKEFLPNQKYVLEKYLHGQLRRKYNREVNGNRELSMKQAKEILGEVEIPELSKLIDKNQFYVKVSDIECDDKKEVYDLTVSNGQTYIGNGFVSHNSGGGTGFSFSKLREKNSPVRTTSGVSSGPITFMKVFNSATDAVKQGGTRRGANMAILNVDHPDILDFIKAKEENTELNNFNISVGVTEQFMNAVQQDGEYKLISPHTKKIVKKVKARDVFNIIIEMAHKNGEPGIVFVDRLDRFNPTPAIGKIEATNPCGEQPLLPNEACNLGSVNLSLMVKDGKINWNLLKKTVCTATNFLDDVIDRSAFPLPEIEKMAKANRKIGLGVMGWADMLVQLGIPYNSDKAIKLAEELMEFIDYHSKLESMKLAKEKGAFPNFDKSVFKNEKLIRASTKLDWDKLKQDIKKNGIRNATTTTIAPTGTISMIADASSGVEPIFSLVYVKNVMDGEKLVYVNKYFEKIAKGQNFYSKRLMEKISEKGSLKNIKKVPDSLKKVFVTAHDISPDWHIKIQAAFQSYVDNAVSKTINFSNNAKVDDIRAAYELAYQLGCKGVTVYRDGSREEQVLSIGKKMKEQEKSRIAPRRRPDTTVGVTKKIETGCGHLYVTINTDEKGVCEVFTQMGKVGGCASAQLEAIARLISLVLRSNIKMESIIKQLRSIRCPSPMWSNGSMTLSCADGIAKALEEFIAQDGNGLKEVGRKEKGKRERVNTSPISTGLGAICPECGTALEFKEGCKTCPICGWSKCS